MFLGSVILPPLRAEVFMAAFGRRSRLASTEPAAWVVSRWSVT